MSKYPENTENRRTLATRAALKDAAKELMRGSGAQKINVKRLCARAGVNRATFYHHYTDLDDFFRELREDVISQFGEIFLARYTEGRDTREVIREVLQMVREEPYLCGLLSGENAEEPVKNLIRDEDLKRRWMEQYHLTEVQLARLGLYVNGGAMALLRSWQTNGFTEPEDEVAKFLEVIIWQGLDGIARQGE